MPEISPNRLMSFDHGIDDIVFARKHEQAAQSLPERRNLMPSDDNVRAQLSQLLEKPNTTRFLEEALRPEINDRDLLMPSRFADVLKDALASLSSLADSGAGDSRVLNRAVALVTSRNDIVLAVLIVSIIFMMILPLPTALVDVLIGANMTISAILLMVALYLPSPLAFSSFPSVLLVTTLFRLGI